MIKIAIVDDNENTVNDLAAIVKRYGSETGNEFSVRSYGNGVDFLTESSGDDIVFLDIQMPMWNGLYTAKKLREKGDDCIIIFVTNLKQYAVSGYDVDASAYVVKPFHYETIAPVLRKAVAKANKRQKSEIVLNVKGGIKRLALSDIVYIEVIRHKLVYHTTDGDFETWDSLSKTYEKLCDKGFEYCNSCYLVNLDFVHDVIDDTLGVGEYQLKISRAKKKSFMTALNKYLHGR